VKTQQPQTIGEIIKTNLPPIIAASEKEHLHNFALEKPMTMKEVSVFLSKPKATVYQWTSKKTIPHVKCGRENLFFPSEITEWLKSKRVKTQEQLAQEVSKNLCQS
jgi:excisionase family DNA binding protein